MNKVNKYDSYETRTGMIFLWLFAFSLTGFVISLNVPTMAFAPIPLCVFTLMSLFTALHWFKRAMFATGEYEDTEPTTMAEVRTEEQAAMDARVNEQVTRITNETARRTGEYVFLYGVCSLRIGGEKAWYERFGLSRENYRESITELEQFGIVSPSEPGKQRRILMPFSKAVNVFAYKKDDLEYFSRVDTNCVTALSPTGNTPQGEPQGSSSSSSNYGVNLQL